MCELEHPLQPGIKNPETLDFIGFSAFLFSFRIISKTNYIIFCILFTLILNDYARFTPDFECLCKRAKRTTFYNIDNKLDKKTINLTNNKTPRIDYQGVYC